MLQAIAMRRHKTQEVQGKPLLNLPKKEVFVEYIKLSDEERAVYETMQAEGKLIVSRYIRQTEGRISLKLLSRMIIT